MHREERIARDCLRLWVELEVDSRGVMPERGVEPRRAPISREILQAAVALPAAPMIPSMRGQQSIAARELRLRHVAPDEIGRKRGEGLPLEMVAGEQQARAPVHEQARRLRLWNVLSAAMKIPSELGVRGRSAPEEPVAGGQVIGEHADRAARQLGERSYLEFDFSIGEVGQDFAGGDSGLR